MVLLYINVNYIRMCDVIIIITADRVEIIEALKLNL